MDWMFIIIWTDYKLILKKKRLNGFMETSDRMGLLELKTLFSRNSYQRFPAAK
ncbi:hypothetical protein FHS68_003565 [Dyadobacter arcticus]|uniref:Uncharacterized protein n=1 Tax=Dyadobacter arcticus TaxID=1078754 RepID=A0ABX0UN15_9BACT|nr:hypothetical protein [Dyadobacter arcticus]